MGNGLASHFHVEAAANGNTSQELRKKMPGAPSGAAGNDHRSHCKQ
jgi:hypothetical protein